MIERVKQKYNDLYESDDDIKALTSLYELVNYRINILNGINHANNRRFKQKIHPLIKKLTILLSYQANKKDLKFKIEEVQNNYITISDNIYLAMFILLENAVKHSFSGNDINIGFEEDSDNLIVTIENIGAKIEKDEKDKLCIRGYRGKNTSTKGTGVGLSLAKEIFDKNNCEMNIKIVDINHYQSLFIVSIKFLISNE